MARSADRRDGIGRGWALRVLTDDRGSVTAEFAVTLPAVIAFVALLVVVLHLAGSQVGLVAQAGSAARLVARGDAAEAVLAGSRAESVVSERDGLTCVELAQEVDSGPLAAFGITLRASACSITEARP